MPYSGFQDQSRVDGAGRKSDNEVILIGRSPVTLDTADFAHWGGDMSERVNTPTLPLYFSNRPYTSPRGRDWNQIKSMRSRTYDIKTNEPTATHVSRRAKCALVLATADRYNGILPTRNIIVHKETEISSYLFFHCDLRSPALLLYLGRQNGHRLQGDPTAVGVD